MNDSEHELQEPSQGAQRPPVVVTGATGAIGSALAAALGQHFDVVGLDLDCSGAGFECIEADLTSDASLEAALTRGIPEPGDTGSGDTHLLPSSERSREDAGTPMVRESYGRGLSRKDGRGRWTPGVSDF